MKKMELLAPAGNMQGLRAVINAGCDAVYLGGKDFSARAYAGNFDDEELIYAIEYAHLNGVRVHLALNTLLKNNEIEKTVSYLRPLYEAGLDAVIIQDTGLIDLLHKSFPDLPLHASTQMSVTGPEGARLLKDSGIKRVITARELSLDVIKAIKDETGMEVECFVHGSLCYCYSGKCLMSSIFGGRSGNRGRCAQPCRLAYDLYKGKRKLNRDGDNYLLSPRDLAAIDILPEIMNAGVDSLKIEGRMKRPEYCAGVVSVYRKYIDLFESGGKYRVSEGDKNLLKDLYNREGFTTGYYLNSPGKELLSLKKERFRGNTSDQNALYKSIKKNIIEKERKTGISGKASFRKGVRSSLELTEGNVRVTVCGAVPEKAQKSPVSEGTLREKLLKTGNTPFEFKELSVDADDDIYINVKDINELRRSGTETLKEAVIESFRRHCGEAEVQEEYGDPTGIIIKNKSGSINRKMPEIQVSVQDLKSVSDIAEESFIDRIFLDISCLDKEGLTEALESFSEIDTPAEKWIMLPYVIKDRKILEITGSVTDPVNSGVPGKNFDTYNGSGIKGVLVNDPEALGYFSRKIPREKIMAGPYLYTMNDLSREYIQRLCIYDTVPYELNSREIAEMDNSGSVLEVYGRIPLMITANVPMKADMYKSDIALKDRKGEFFPVRHCPLSSYNVIYNSRPLDLIEEAGNINSLNVHGIRISFIEGEKDIRGICRAFCESFKRGKDVLSPGRFTKGHFLRGVE